MQNENRIPVAVLMGGGGYEHDVSLRSAQNLLCAIDRTLFDPIPILIDKKEDWYLISSDNPPRPTFPVRMEGKIGFLNDGEILSVAAVFPMLHGDKGEDGRIQGVLDAVGIPYVGEGVLSGALTSDKIHTKIIAEHFGVPTVEWICATEADNEDSVRRHAEVLFGYPMFIKPTGLGSSLGAHRVLTKDDFSDAYRDAIRLGKRILIERMLTEKRELEIGFFKDKDELFITPAGEVALGGFYDYDEKYSEKSNAKIFARADLPSEIASALSGYTTTLIRALNLNAMGRIDFFLHQGRIYLNEINTMPGFTESSLYPRMMELAGISPTELITRLILSGIKRSDDRHF